MMILAPGANTITLTLNELKTIAVPEYVIVFKSYDTKKQVACILGVDLSEYPERTNEFTITVQADPDHTDAEVSLNSRGHKFFVYEMEDASGFDFENIDTLKLEELDGEVERGLCEYLIDPVEIKAYRDKVLSIKTY